MNLKKIFEKNGFRDLLVKSVVFVNLIFLLQIITSLYIETGTIAKDFKPFSLVLLDDAVLFALLIFVIYNRKELIDIKQYKIKWSDWFVFGLMFFVFIAFHYKLKFSAINSPELWLDNLLLFLFLKYLLFCLVLFSLALAVFGSRFALDFYKKYKRQFLPLLLFFIIYYILIAFVQRLWSVFSGSITHILYFMLGLTYSNVSLNLGSDSAPILVVENFGAKIGSSCSGIDSMLLFTSLFLIIVAVDFKKIDLKRALSVFFPALAGVFLLNVLRIYLLFIVGINISREVAAGLFHTNVGYVLFCAYFFLFLWFAYPWIAKTRRKKVS